MFHGFGERMSKTLTALPPSTMKIMVVTPSVRRYARFRVPVSPSNCQAWRLKPSTPDPIEKFASD